MVKNYDFLKMSDEDLLVFLMGFQDKDEETESLVRMLPYAVMYDMKKARSILEETQGGKTLVAVYPEIEETDTSKMEYVGSIQDGALYLK